MTTARGVAAGARRRGRREQPAPACEVIAGRARLDRGGNGGEHRVALRRGDRQRAQQAGLDMRRGGGQRVDHEADAVGDQVGVRGRAALVRDLGHRAQRRHLRQHERGQLLRTARAGRAIADLAGVVADELEQFRERIHRRLGTHQEHIGREVGQRYRREVLHRVVGQVGHQEGIDRHVRRGLQQRVAVGLRLGDGVGADRLRRARAILYDHRFAERGFEFPGEQPRHQVARPAGGDRHDDPDGPGRKRGLGRRLVRGNGEGAGDQCGSDSATCHCGTA